MQSNAQASPPPRSVASRGWTRPALRLVRREPGLACGALVMFVLLAMALLPTLFASQSPWPPKIVTSKKCARSSHSPVCWFLRRSLCAMPIDVMTVGDPGNVTSPLALNVGGMFTAAPWPLPK